jgi:glycosyltransferase involved in cell wall biosynthesis
VKKLAIVSTHPIQYYAPIFQMLAKRARLTLQVFYTWSQSQETVRDHSFGLDIQWDIPLLDGYPHCFVENRSANPGTHRRDGIVCPTLIAEIEAFQPDAILVFGWFWKSHHDVIRHFFGKRRILFRGDSTLLDERADLRTWLRRRYLRWVYRKVDLALFVGQNNRDYFAIHGLGERQLRFAPHAIDNARFVGGVEDQYELQAQQWREKLGLSEAHFVVLFVGKFEDKKNPLLLIEAIARLHAKYPQLRLLLIGNGPLEVAVQQATAGAAFAITLPFQNQSLMPLVYRLAQVFCLPSSGPGETWGLAVNEAMASGRAVIASDKVGSTRDLIQHGVNGFAFPANQLTDLMQVIEQAIHSDIKQMGQVAQQSILPWNFENICAAIEQSV